MKIVTKDNSFRRYDRLKTLSNQKTSQTVVAVRKNVDSVTYTIKNIRWSKYKFINFFIRLWIRVKY